MVGSKGRLIIVIRHACSKADDSAPLKHCSRRTPSNASLVAPNSPHLRDNRPSPGVTEHGGGRSCRVGWITLVEPFVYGSHGCLSAFCQRHAFHRNACSRRIAPSTRIARPPCHACLWFMSSAQQLSEFMQSRTVVNQSWMEYYCIKPTASNAEIEL